MAGQLKYLESAQAKFANGVTLRGGSPRFATSDPITAR
jgi:hypothetical protein